MAQSHSIVQINTRDRRGGAERVAWNLFQAYQARGRMSWLVVGKKYSNDPHVWEIVNAPYASTRWARTGLRMSEALSPLHQRGLKGVAMAQEQLRCWPNQRHASSGARVMKILSTRGPSNSSTCCPLRLISSTATTCTATTLI